MAKVLSEFYRGKIQAQAWLEATKAPFTFETVAWSRNLDQRFPATLTKKNFYTITLVDIAYEIEGPITKHLKPGDHKNFWTFYKNGDKQMAQVKKRGVFPFFQINFYSLR